MLLSSSTMLKSVIFFAYLQATIPFMNGIAKWKASISLIPQVFALVLSSGLLGFTLHVLSTSCLHSTSQRLFFHLCKPNGIISDGWYSYALKPCVFFQVMAVTRSTICRKGIESLPRGGAIIYYVCVFLYFWVLSTPVVSLVFGSYLYVCINWFHIHFDEAFSSLRIANYKAFTRFHIKKNGDLEVFTLAVDKVRL